MRSFLHARQNVFANDRHDRSNVAGMQLCVRLLRRLRLAAARVLSSITYRQGLKRHLPYGTRVPYVADSTMSVAWGRPGWRPEQPWLLAFACNR